MAKNSAQASSPEQVAPPAEDPTPAVSPEVSPTPPPPPDPPVSPSAGSQYVIIYEIRTRTGQFVEEKQVHVTATSEAEAFDLAAKAVEAITVDDEPIVWRYTGRFNKVA